MLKSRVSKSGVRHVRLLVLGSWAAGKSALVAKIINKPFPEKHFATLGSELYIKQLEYRKEQVALHLWSCGGHERFHPIIQLNYDNAHAAIIVYDRTDEASFYEVSFWRNEIMRACPSCVMVVVGLKSDLSDDIKVGVNDGEAQAAKWNLPHVAASAKTGEEVDTIVQMLLNKVMV